MEYRANSREELSSWLATRQNSPLHVAGSAHATRDSDQLVMSGLNRIISYEPEEMIAVAEAGVTVERLNSELRSKGQWIPTLENNDSATTLGGLLALGTWHPREQLGAKLRVHVLGGTFCTVDGKLFKSGSRVVKSVAGYDTHRAFVGSNGLLGVIVEVTLKVVPRPEKIVRFMIDAGHRDKVQVAAPLVVEEVEGRLLIELGGYEEDVMDDLDKIDGGGLSLLDEAQWESTIALLQAQHSNREPDPTAMRVLGDLRSAFDPLGLLC